MKVLIIAGVALAIVVVLGIMAAVALPVFLTQRSKGQLTQRATQAGRTAAQLSAPPFCGTVVSASMPPGTAAYVRALTENNRRDAQIKPVGDRYSRNNAIALLRSDRSYTTDVKHIAFTGASVAASRSLVQALQTYDSVLEKMLPTWGTVATQLRAQLYAAGQARSRAAVNMRNELHLPPSTCSFPRPG